MSRVLVTGAAGFIGSHVVERLLKQGREVIGLDCFTGYYSPEIKRRNISRALSGPGFSLVEEDLLDGDLHDLLRGVEGVIHLAAEPGVRASWGENFSRYLRRNVEATQRLVEAISGSRVERFVFASSSSIYGSAGEGPVKEDAPRRPASPYGMSKLAAEELVFMYARAREVPATALRYFTVYGPRQRPEMALARFISAAVRGEIIRIFGDGEQTREMTYVSDVVEATVAALEAPSGGVYNVGGGSRATVNELVQKIFETLGVQGETRHEPWAEGDVRATWADLERARRELGYQPRVSLEEGIRRQVRWSLNEGAVEITG
jgi:UDP-glucuronate 4-epimerase